MNGCTVHTNGCAPTAANVCAKNSDEASGPESKSAPLTSWVTRSPLRHSTESPATIVSRDGENVLPGIVTVAVSAERGRREQRAPARAALAAAPRIT